MEENEVKDKAGKPNKPKSRRVGQALKRGPNKWLIRIFIGYKPNGQNVYFNKTFRCRTRRPTILSGRFSAAKRRDFSPFLHYTRAEH